jgi:hypothetical protein
MNNLKNKFIAGGIVVIMSATAAGAFAKGGKDDSERALQRGANLDYIFTELSLSEQQQADVNAVMEAHRAEREEVRNSMREAMRNADEKPSREEMQTVRDTNRTVHLQALTDELNTVLPADDAADLVAYLDAHQGRGGEKKAGHMGQGEGAGKDGRSNRANSGADNA